MKKGPSITENTVGWIATLMVLVAYALNAFGFLVATSPLYALLNLFGGGGVCYISYRYRNYQSAIINLVWVAVAIISLISLLKIL